MGRAKRDNGAAAVSDCGLPLTPFYGTAIDKRYLGVREERVRERENRIIRICMRLVDRGSAKRA
jgi:hypothetical protein